MYTNAKRKTIGKLNLQSSQVRFSQSSKEEFRLNQRKAELHVDFLKDTQNKLREAWGHSSRVH